MSYSIISIKNVDKIYRIYKNPKDRVKQYFIFNKKKYYKEFWALKNISFNISKGERLGIIGKNGAGKSTLLQILTGILEPTTGEVQVNGKIAALLELGSGFNIEFTGEENIYLNGMLLGMSEEDIKLRFQDIVKFADIGDFIYQPVKTYSSGMFVRLAFSVAIHSEPDIFIIDEALSVGDVFFQRKCFNKIDELINNKKTTLIYVSHEMSSLKQVCNRVILLDGGQIIQIGEPQDVVNSYFKLLYNSHGINDNSNKYEESLKYSYSSGYALELKDRERYGDKKALISKVILEERENNFIETGSQVKFTLIVSSYSYINNLVVGFRIKTITGIDVYASNTRDEGQILLSLKPSEDYKIELIIDTLNLVKGEYFLSFAIGYQEGDIYFPMDHRIDATFIKISQSNLATGIVNVNHKLVIKEGMSI